MNDGDQTFKLTENFFADSSLNPTIAAITPNSNLAVFGGFDLTITGTNLKNGDEKTEVWIGENQCEVTSSTDTEIICIVPVSRSGPNTVVVHVPLRGIKISTIHFGYSVLSMDIDSGSYAGGNKIKISGSGFGVKSESVEVRFDDGTSMCDILSVTDTEIVCETPAASTTVAIDNNGINQGGKIFILLCCRVLTLLELTYL